MLYVVLLGCCVTIVLCETTVDVSTTAPRRGVISYDGVTAPVAVYRLLCAGTGASTTIG